MSSARRHRAAQTAWLIPLAIFTFAFVIRLIYVSQVEESPYWRVPLVDSRNYDASAMEMLETSWLSPLPQYEGHYTPYYQPPLYQAFLAVIYGVFGHSIMAAMVIQFLLGSLSCVLVYLLGLRLFDRRIGISAAIAMAITASQLFYEGRLLPPVLIILFNLLILLLAAKQVTSPTRWRWPVIGLLIGLSAITRPDILLFLPLLVAWMWIERRAVLHHRPLVWIAVLLVGAAIPIALVAVRNAVVGRDFALISANGGINFYIGNSAEMDRTLSVRPGIEWDVLVYNGMMGAGTDRPSDSDRYYYRLTLGQMREHPRRAALNFGRKLLWAWRGPEIRRNEDEYYLRRVSPLYAGLLWQVGGFGFPFGVIAPLALLGMVMCRRRRRELFLLYAYVITQVTMLVAFFPCTRYRAPMVPILLLFGAAACVGLVGRVRLVRRRGSRDLAVYAFLLAVFAVVPALCPTTFEGTRAQIEAENYRLLGIAYYIEGRMDRAIPICEKGSRLDPDNPDLHRWLMKSCYDRRKLEEAEWHARQCIRLVPEYGPIYRNLYHILLAQRDYIGAYEVRRTIQDRQMSGGGWWWGL